MVVGPRPAGFRVYRYLIQRQDRLTADGFVLRRPERDQGLDA
jgi:hypothetical protein